MAEDTSLVQRLKTGEKKAIHEWYASFAPRLKAFFAGRVKQSHDVDELTHDTFLSCLESLPLYRGEGNFYGWMVSIARHELADYYRKLYAKKVIAVLPLGEQALEAAGREESGEAGETVQEALAKLPAAVSELLALKYIDKLSVEAIATQMEETPHAIQGRLYRARKSFRKIFEELESL